jgi:transposase-like protein
MDRNACQQFFLCPDRIGQRRYEVLRAVFVDEDTALDVADRFGLSHGTVRNWVSQFGAQLEHGELPPFSIVDPRTGKARPT